MWLRSVLVACLLHVLAAQREPARYVPGALCFLPPDPGDCNDPTSCPQPALRWASVEPHLPNAFANCREFQYSGSGGNHNNFVDIMDCIKFCGQISQDKGLPVDATLTFLFLHDEDDLDTDILSDEDFLSGLHSRLAVWLETDEEHLSGLEVNEETDEEVRVRLNVELGDDIDLMPYESIQIFLYKNLNLEYTDELQYSYNGVVFRPWEPSIAPNYRYDIETKKTNRFLVIGVVLAFLLTIVASVSMFVLCAMRNKFRNRTTIALKKMRKKQAALFDKKSRAP